MFEVCDDYGSTRIALLKWRLDKPNHWPYIHSMFQYINYRHP